MNIVIKIGELTKSTTGPARPLRRLTIEVTFTV